MRAAEIADVIAARGSYVRRDGTPVPAMQVSATVHQASSAFVIEGGLISLPAGDPVGIAPSAPVAGGPDIVIVGCGRRKADRPLPARELYTFKFDNAGAY